MKSFANLQMELWYVNNFVYVLYNYQIKDTSTDKSDIPLNNISQANLVMLLKAGDRIFFALNYIMPFWHCIDRENQIFYRLYEPLTYVPLRCVLTGKDFAANFSTNKLLTQSPSSHSNTQR